MTSVATRFGRQGAALLLAASAIVAPAHATPPGAATVERHADRLLVSWVSDRPVDVLLASRPEAPLAEAQLVSAGDTDGRAEAPAGGTQRRYVLLRNTATGEVTRAAERLIPLEAGSNFRDIGGYPAADGKRVRWGAIYRSGATPLLSPADRTRIAALGLTNLVDLRSDEERQLAPSRIEDVPYTAVGYSLGAMMGSGEDMAMDKVYARLPQTMAPQLRQIFAKLLRREGPLAYNCSAGQDRTGFATAVVLSALGTPYPVIVEDYHLSTRYRRPEFEMPRFDPAQFPNNAAAQLFARFQADPRAAAPQPLKTASGTAYLDFAFAELTRRWGGVDGYLRQELRLTDADIVQLRRDYTE
ncbi:tyrosine-protein phosphatase [Novosphingobium piscinae]|uniref:Tyrosine-protein phosphatase n=1 Tax=Novosphingobium piscinae TaxID=1507448 RepID=A0A7X1FVR8_9SPHN|nr:tyrosine-protein phosphatase [Novosphingobium piscinae]MBC2667779.1 tyrosine-protein phosphatase [Novosphingobium piscinae]